MKSPHANAALWWERRRKREATQRDNASNEGPSAVPGFSTSGQNGALQYIV
jgi:hypothetical protein